MTNALRNEIAYARELEKTLMLALEALHLKGCDTLYVPQPRYLDGTHMHQAAKLTAIRDALRTDIGG